MAKRKTNKDTSLWSHKHDYPTEAIWNTYVTLAKLIIPILMAFRDIDKHSHPSEFDSIRAWNKAIDKMIRAFELCLGMLPSSGTQESDELEEGFNLFCKHYLDLWD